MSRWNLIIKYVNVLTIMQKPSVKFVFAKEDIRNIDNSIIIEKLDVGILQSYSGNEISVFFIRPWKKLTTRKTQIVEFNIKRTGDNFSKKVCNVCHKLLQTVKFAKNQNAKNNRSVRRPSCKDCRKFLEGVNMSPKIRKEWEQKKPNSEPFECPVCLKRTIAGVTCKVVLDHNHKTGEVRGWICDSCNTGIGRFKDDVELLKQAMRFLGYAFN
jgi:hypothetical protein